MDDLTREQLEIKYAEACRLFTDSRREIEALKKEIERLNGILKDKDELITIQVNDNLRNKIAHLEIELKSVIDK